MPRELAAQVLERVLDQGAYSHLALDAALRSSSITGRDRGLATELVYGTLARLGPLDAILERAVHGGIERLDAPVLHTLRVATYQLVFLDRVPDHAALDEAVEHVKSFNPRAAGLVNGVLRSVARQDEWCWWRPEDEERKPVRYLAQRYGFPSWLANRLWQRVGTEGAEVILAGFNARPPLWAWHTGPEPPKDITWAPADGVPRAGRLEGMGERERALVEAGELVIQDLGSQLVGWLTRPAPGARVLDACAGLGGKSIQLASLVDDLQITCVEPNASKLELLEQAPWPGGPPQIVQSELSDFAQTEPEPFDVVLVDAPCSGLGTMRRHPEVRHRRGESDLRSLSELQGRLLEQAAGLVAPGGRLVYAVCTFTREEGTRQLERLLESHPELELEPPPPAEGLDWERFVTPEGWLMTWPHRHDADAFFAARLRRRDD